MMPQKPNQVVLGRIVLEELQKGGWSVEWVCGERRTGECMLRYMLLEAPQKLWVGEIQQSSLWVKVTGHPLTNRFSSRRPCPSFIPNLTLGRIKENRKP